MANAADTFQPRTLRELNIVLRNSFQAMKNDVEKINDEMEGAKKSQLVYAHDFNELRKDISALKQDFVTVDKLNLLKISLSDIQKELKKISSTEKDESKNTAQLAEKLAEQVEKAKEDYASSSKKIENKLEGFAKTKETETAIEELRREIKRKTKSWKANLQSFAKEIEGEFGKINRNFEAVEKNKEEIIGSRINSFQRQFENKIDTLKKETSRYAKEIDKHKKELSGEISAMLKKEQAEALTKKINEEFDRAKLSIESLGGSLEKLDTDMEKISGRIKTFREMHTNFNILNTNFEGLKEGVEDDIYRLKDDMKGLGRKVREDRRELKTSAAKIIKLKKITSPMLLISNIIIAFSFVLLITAGVMFFVLSESFYIMDWLMIAAVVVFVIGIILRMVSTFKA